MFFSTEVDKHVREAKIVFVCVNTPTKAYGVGQGVAADLKYVEAVTRKIAELAVHDTIIVEKSTVPVRAAESIRKITQVNQQGARFDILSNPEFLAEGTAIKDLTTPDRVLIGCDETPNGLAAAEVLASLYAEWIPRDRIIFSNLWSSELSKLTANAFLAQRISSINSISAICEATGADVQQVARAVGLDSRVGSKFLNASVGFGGSCFQKDVLNLVYLCECEGLQEVADYWRGVITINDWQKKRFAHNVVSKLFKTISGKKIAIFGFAFKADTSDTRESPAIYVTGDLLEERANVAIFDPKVPEDHLFWELDQPGITPDGVNARELVTFNSEDPYAVAAGAHAILVLTEWPLFRTLDWQRIFASMQRPAFIFDGRLMLDHAALREIGFEVHCIGKRFTY